MGTEYSRILMAGNIRVSGNMAGKMARVLFSTPMVIPIQVSLKMAKWQARVFILLKMEINTKGHGKMIK